MRAESFLRRDLVLSASQQSRLSRLVAIVATILGSCRGRRGVPRALRYVLLVGFAMMASLLLSTGKGLAHTPHNLTLTVDTVTVDVLQAGGTDADVDGVYNRLNGAVNASADFRNVVKTAANLHSGRLEISVFRNSTAVSIGAVLHNPDSSCCSNRILIDVGDTDLIGSFLDAGVGTPEDRELVRANFLTEVLIHEVYHTNNVVDPQLNENPILADLQVFYRRLNYYTVMIGTHRYLNFEIYSSNPVRNVRLDTTAYDLTRCVNPGFWEEPGASCGVPSPSSVGGIAGLPDPTAQAAGFRSTAYTLPFVVVVIAGLAFLVGGAYGFRRREVADPPQGMN